MARPKRTECKVEGCTNPPYTYPSGSGCAYCREHIHVRKGSTRPGFDTMTGPMMDVLKLLRTAYQQDAPFIELRRGPVDYRTIRCLLERDWMFESPGLDGIRYKITGRGLKALAAHEKRINRRDGICPRCGERPRSVRKNGARCAYCVECERKRNQKRRAEGKARGNPDRPCSRCRTRPRYHFPGGDISSYCEHCERVQRRRRARRQRRREMKAILAGAPVPLCKTKGCDNPRRVFTNCMSDYCADCISRNRRRWKYNRVMRRQKTLQKAS